MKRDTLFDGITWTMCVWTQIDRENIWTWKP